jgi:hypothetical protein
VCRKEGQPAKLGIRAATSIAMFIMRCFRRGASHCLQLYEVSCLTSLASVERSNLQQSFNCVTSTIA